MNWEMPQVFCNRVEEDEEEELSEEAKQQLEAEELERIKEQARARRVSAR